MNQSAQRFEWCEAASLGRYLDRIDSEDALDAAAERQYSTLRAQTLGDVMDAIETSDRATWNKLDEILWELSKRLAESGWREQEDDVDLPF
jgi:hypothetical protein